MEASEKPQLPLEPDSPIGAVRAIGDRLVIDSLTVHDERAAALVRERQEAGQEPARTVTDAIEIGARVLDREDTAAEVDWVRAELERAQSGFERRGAELSERLATGIEKGNDALTQQISDAFGADRNDSVQSQIRAIVSEATEAQKLELTRMLSSEDGSNPLSAVQSRLAKAILESEERHRHEMARLRESHTGESRAMQAQVAELKENLARLLDKQGADQVLAEAEEAGTRKGRSFEERVHAAIERIAVTRGDCAHPVGDVPGAGGSKKGDSLVELGAGEGSSLGRIVFEIKDSQLNKPKAWAEMNGALEARNADYAILVVAGDDAIPTGNVEEMLEYQGNKLVVAVDPDQPNGRALELAYRYASLRVRASREVAAGVDGASVLAAVAEARDVIAGFRTVKSALTSATNNVARARTGVETIEPALIDSLDRIEGAIADGDERKAR
ncbi:MAG TPA: hypothetical protein VHH72_02190 [Solirubrobacterales bacterium]|jgi:hypothetical protein|nr:hypothetical protein [Solirubrobacterales bacterium]